MAFVPVPNVGKAEMVFRGNNVIMENVFHVQYAATPDSTDLLNTLDVLRSWWNTNLKSSVPTAISLVNLINTDQTSQTGPRVEDTTGLPIAGTSGSEPLAHNVTVAVRLLTEKRGRSFRGRSYFVGLSETTVQYNSLVGAFQTTLLNAYSQLLVDLSAAGTPLVVASRQFDNQPRVIGVATPVTSVFIDPTVDSQRRRLPGRGT